MPQAMLLAAEAAYTLLNSEQLYKPSKAPDKGGIKHLPLASYYR